MTHPSIKFNETANNDYLGALATADQLFPIEEPDGEQHIPDKVTDAACNKIADHGASLGEAIKTNLGLSHRVNSGPVVTRHLD